MAGMDYISCAECGKRLIFDGDLAIRTYLEDETLTCGHCVKKLKKRIEKLEKIKRWRK